MTTTNVATLAELKTALAAAAANGQSDTITLTADISAASGADFVTGAGGNDLLKIALTDGQTLSIVGGGHTVDANYFGRVLEVPSGAVSISDLTLREGGLAGDGGAGQDAGHGALGAGIYNAANLTLTNVTVTANAASGGGGGYGGGYGGGGGGGGGAGSVAGHGGGGASNNGYAASGGTGGAGGKGNYYPETSGGGGGSSEGGAGGQYSGASAGDGGTAHIATLWVGGGGGGAGGGVTSGDSGAGGAAVGGVYNTTTGVLRITGGAITGNVGAGGGGGVTSGPGHDAAGGIAVGGLMNLGRLNLDNVTLSGNAAAGGISSLDGQAISHIDRYNTGVLNTAPTGGVSIAGTATQGQVLTASNTLADADGLGTIAYQWKSDGVAIGAATSSTFTLAQAQVGHVVTVTASYTDGGSAAESATSSGTTTVANLNDAPTGSVTISGTATQGQALTAANTLADADGLGTVSYQWKSDGADISGATGASFTPTASQVGHVITVAASYVDGQSTAESVSSAATSAVAAPAGPNTSVGTLAELKAALAAAATDGLANVITLTADISATGSGDFVSGVGGSDLVKIAITDGQTLSIVGGGHTLDANSFGRVLEVSSGVVAISNLTLREGAVAGNGGDTNSIGGAGLGGGIYNTGDLTLTNVTVTANAASGGGGGTGGYLNGGGGGGGGPGLFAGAGGAGSDLGVDYYSSSSQPGASASGGIGGMGGSPAAYPQEGGQGGSSLGGAGGTYGFSHGGHGGAATAGLISVGGGGGGAGGRNPGDPRVGAGGAAVGGIFNGGTLVLSGGAVTGNVAAGGGGGGNDQNMVSAAGGAAVGGVRNTGTLTLDHASVTGNAAGGGQGGRSYIHPGVDGTSVNDISGAYNQLHTGGVGISGAATQGQTLTAVNTLADGDGLGGISYQWKADGTTIGGATATSYTLTSAELGKHISVTASYVDGGGFAESASSAASAAVASPVAPQDPSPPAPVTTATTVDGAAVSTTTTTAADGSQSQTVVVAPQTAGRTDSTGGAGAADIPLVTVNGGHLITIGLPTGTGFSAAGPVAAQSGGAALATLTGAVGAAVPTAAQTEVGDGVRAFLQMRPEAPILVQTLTLSGAHTDTPLAIAGSTLGSGVVTALVIDTHNLAGQTVLTLDNVDFAAVIGAVHITGGAGAQTVYADGAQQFMVLGADDDQLHGGDGSDTVGSAGGDDSLYGDAGNDSVFGGIGGDMVFGGSGDDVAQGNQGDDLVQGNAGNDTLYGGQGDDVVRGGQGDDRAFGDLGDDIVFGDLGNDTLSGGTGADILQGNQGNDALDGGAGADTLLGGQGDDVLAGGEGDDLILGDRGNDTLTGGAGGDTFSFAAGHGADRITDFHQAEGDRIQLVGSHGAYTTAQVGADTVLDFGAGDTIVLVKVQMSSLTSGWLVG